MKLNTEQQYSSGRRQLQKVQHVLLTLCQPQRGLMALLATTLLLACVEPVIAQSDNRSHRRLELPQGGSADLKMQMQMLSQLQKFFGGEQQPNGAPPAVSPGQMNMLRKMMESFSGQVPDGLMEQMQNLPPEVISNLGQQLQNNPQARQQAMELLQQFMRDRQFPQAGANGGTPMLPPGANPNPSNHAGGSTGDERPQNEGQSGSSASDDSDGAGGGFSFDNLSVDNMLKKMRELERKARGESGETQTPENSAGSARNSTGGANSRTRPGGESQANRQDDGEWDPLDPNRAANQTADTGRSDDRRMSRQEGINRIDELLRKKNGEPFGSGGNGSSANSSSEGLSETVENPNDAGGDQSGDGRIRSVSDFLRNFVPGALSGNGDESTATGNVAGGPAKNRTDAESTEENRTVEEIRQAQEEVKREVAQRGFAETLKRIGREAMQEARSDRSSAGPAGGTSGNGDAPMSDSMVEAITGIAKDVVEILQDEGVTMPDRSGSRRSRRPAPDRSSRNDESFLGQLRETASEVMSEIGDTPDVVSSGAASSSSTDGVSSGALIPVIVFVMLVAATFLLAFRSGLIPIPGSSETGSSLLATPNRIRTKEDVVRAFHSLALSPERASDEWWTHQKVVDTLVEQEPHKSDVATTLGQLYEEARYLPDDYDFSEEKIEDVKLALAEYRS